MFAALSQYEQRFQNLERVMTRNALLLEQVDRSLERMENQIRDLCELATLFEKRFLIHKMEEEKICI